MISAQQLALILSEEFARSNWGYIEPRLFYHVANPEPEDGNDKDVEGMERVLARVARRLSEESG